MIELTNSQSEYLKAVYAVSLKGEIRVTKIAQYLNCSKPSVVRALKTLDDLKLIKYKERIVLTSLGERYALNLIRRDNVLQRFFIEVLGIESELAIKDANNLRNVVSCYTITKLEDYIGEVLGVTDLVANNYCLCSLECSNCNLVEDENKSIK